MQHIKDDNEIGGEPPTIDEQCPDCGGRILVWVHHSNGAGFTQSVVHIPPDEEKNTEQ